LIDGDLLYCIVGGPGSVAVAFDKRNGQEIWKAIDAEAQGYCPPTLIEHDGTRQLLIWDPSRLNSLNPRTGEANWSLPMQPQYGMSVTAPRYHEGKLFVTGIGSVSAVVQLSEGTWGAEVLWNGTPKTGVYCCNSTPFLEGETIYGCDIASGALVGASLQNGERLWQTTAPTTKSPRGDAHATVFLVKQEDRFFLFNELGDLIIARLSPSGYEELDRAHLLEPTNSAFGRPVVWSHPAFANRCVYARNDREIVCYDLSAN
jgi:outer membrane protein assembly factor BamB